MPPMIGQIRLFPYDFAPDGWIFCDGRSVPIDGNKELFGIVQTTFGGEGDSFCVPDLRAMTPPNCHYCIASKGTDVTYYGPCGETFLRPDYYMPSTLLECGGQTLQTSRYSDLERFMGTRFGSAGPNTFKLPDLRTKNPDDLSYVMTVIGENPENAGTYLGELFLLPFELSRTDYLVLCDGRPFYRQTMPDLFRLLGTRFGGNESEFNRPDLRSATPSQFNYYMSLRGGPPPRG